MTGKKYQLKFNRPYGSGIAKKGRLRPCILGLQFISLHCFTRLLLLSQYSLGKKLVERTRRHESCIELHFAKRISPKHLSLYSN
jgi:hypothetical protein